MSKLPFSTPIGVNFSNTFQTNKIPDATAVQQIVANGITPVKMFNYSQPTFYQAASSAGLEIIAGVPNVDLKTAIDSPGKIVDALQPYAGNVVALMVSNEPLIDTPDEYGPLLSKALRSLNNALHQSAGIGLPLSVPFNSGIQSKSWPPSDGVFNSAFTPYIDEVCSFLKETNSFFTINIYPYYAHIGNPQDVPLDYCLFTKNTPQFTDPNTGKAYYNIFDAQYDAIMFALKARGYGDLPLVVGECGWPTTAGQDASVANASRFNQNLIDHVKSGNGTPGFPNATLQTFVFEMYDENMKGGNNFEPHWGIYKNTTGDNYAPKFSLNW